MKLRKDLKDGIKNIIFDLGGVIIDIDPMLSVEAFGQLCGTDISLDDIFPQHDNFFLAYELGNISDNEFAEAIRKNYRCGHLSDDQICAAWCALIKNPDPARFRLLDKIKEEYRTFVLSNTNGFHVARVEEVVPQYLSGRTFESFFERCFYSHTMHLHKPDRRIYEQVISETGIRPSETLFIDDREMNFTGAREAGLRTYHLTGGETLQDLFG